VKVAIRPFDVADEPYLPTWQAFTLDEAVTVFRDVIRAHCRMWVGTLDEDIVAYLALKGDDYIDRLYVDPTRRTTRPDGSTRSTASRRCGSA